MWVTRLYECLLAIPVLLTCLIFVTKSLGCSCLPPPTVLDQFVKSDNVVTASLKGFEQIDRVIEGPNVYRSYAALLEVEKVYKGDLREKQTIKIFNGGGGDCTMGFASNQIDQTFLLYFGDPHPVGRISTVLYTVSLCSRSTSLKRASADLGYLDNRQAREGQTRLSGTITAHGDNISLPSVSGLAVSVVGPQFQTTLKTGQDGFFELWKIPAGAYKVTFELPPGWKMAGSQVIPTDESRLWTKTSSNTVSLEIVAKKHTEIDSFLTISNEISGKVISPGGDPMRGVCVSAYWLTPTSGSFMIPQNCTNEKGEFVISELPPGKYRIEINTRGRITAANPFETFYYPGVENKEEAETVFVKEGVSVRDIVIKVARMLPLIKISGQLTDKDGQPIVNEEVRFDPHDGTKYETVEVETDKNGNFSFEIALGAKGELKARTNIWGIEFEKCTQALLLRKSRTGRDADIQCQTSSIWMGNRHTGR